MEFKRFLERYMEYVDFANIEISYVLEKTGLNREQLNEQIADYKKQFKLFGIKVGKDSITVIRNW